MTQAEFTSRTHVEVSYKEFDSINEVYMNSEVDKDTFCKMWVAMNKKRVAKSIADKKAQEEAEEKKMAIANIYWSLYYELKYDEKNSLMGWEVLSKKDRKLVEKEGIDATNTLTCNMLHNMALYAGI